MTSWKRLKNGCGRGRLAHSSQSLTSRGTTPQKHLRHSRFVMGQTNHQKKSRLRDPQTVAWLVVISSFILFCVLCTAATFGTYWFLFDSPVAMTTCLTVS